MIRFLRFLFTYIYTLYLDSNRYNYFNQCFISVLFFIIFNPPNFIILPYIIINLFFIIIWAIFQINSPEFIAQTKNILQRINIYELKKILKNCDPKFKEIGESILRLLSKISIEFKEKQSLEELDYLLDNIFSLSQNNRDLYKRFQEFGTKEQKEIMKEKINNHIKSLQETYNMLQAFSGNLTLLEANFNEVKSVSTKLKYINQTMQDLIKEI